MNYTPMFVGVGMCLCIIVGMLGWIAVLLTDIAIDVKAIRKCAEAILNIKQRIG